jgi:hypothetical protein
MKGISSEVHWQGQESRFAKACSLTLFKEEDGMKKTILLTAVLIMAFTGFAYPQTGAGTMWISGTTGYSSAGGDLTGSNRANSISFMPSFLYFAAPNLFLGPALSFERMSQGDYSRYTLGMGVKIGYAFGGNGNVIPYLASGFQFGVMNAKAGSAESKASGTDITLGAGLCYQAVKHVGVTFEAGYHFQSLKPEGEEKSVSGNVIGIGIGVIGMIF